MPGFDQKCNFLTFLFYILNSTTLTIMSYSLFLLFSFSGVIATMPFSKGEVICDYHGEYITEREGNRRMQQLHDEACYIFFFAGRGEKVCIDSQNSPCQCHPHQDTFGRRMNHSRRSPNVKPHIFKLPLPEGTRWHPVFLALKDIQVNEELVWDYGVSSDEEFGGEALGLDWLNS